MSQGNGSISQNDLMKKLVQAKKVMNKVDGGDYQRGQVNESMLLSSPEDVMNNTEYQSNPTRPMGAPSIDRIKNSKLPDAVKKAMIESPIQQMNQISLNDTLDMDFIKGAKRLMEQEGVATRPSAQPKQTIVNNSNIDMSAIAVLIENTIRKVLDEKLNQILTAQTTSTINENLVLKVGDSIFRGKITGVNKAK